MSRETEANEAFAGYLQTYKAVIETNMLKAPRADYVPVIDDALQPHHGQQVSFQKGDVTTNTTKEQLNLEKSEQALVEKYPELTGSVQQSRGALDDLLKKFYQLDIQTMNHENSHSGINFSESQRQLQLSQAREYQQFAHGPLAKIQSDVSRGEYAPVTIENNGYLPATTQIRKDAAESFLKATQAEDPGVALLKWKSTSAPYINTQQILHEHAEVERAAMLHANQELKEVSDEGKRIFVRQVTLNADQVISDQIIKGEGYAAPILGQMPHAKVGAESEQQRPFPLLAAGQDVTLPAAAFVERFHHQKQGEVAIETQHEPEHSR